MMSHRTVDVTLTTSTQTEELIIDVTERPDRHSPSWPQVSLFRSGIHQVSGLMHDPREPALWLTLEGLMTASSCCKAN